MPNTKRDKYDKDGRQWAKELLETLSDELAWSGGIPDSRWIEIVDSGIAMRLRSAFPPPAEDAKALAISLCDIYDPPYMRKDFAIQRADAEIESFAESRVEPWREALNWVTHLLCGQGKRGGAPESGEIEEAMTQARTLLSDSPSPQGSRSVIVQCARIAFDYITNLDDQSRTSETLGRGVQHAILDAQIEPSPQAEDAEALDAIEKARDDHLFTVCPICGRSILPHAHDSLKCSGCDQVWMPRVPRDDTALREALEDVERQFHAQELADKLIDRPCPRYTAASIYLDITKTRAALERKETT